VKKVRYDSDVEFDQPYYNGDEDAGGLTKPGIGTRIIRRYLCTYKYVHISMYCVGRCHRCFLLIIHMKQKHLTKDPFSYTW